MTLTMAPPSPLSIIRLPAACAHRKLPSRTIEVTAFHPFGDRSSAFTTKFPAALFTRQSMRPNVSTAALISASTCSGSRTSVGSASAVPPAPSIIAAVSASGSARRPATTTAAPRRENSSAIARPMPLPPPVTTATCPSNVPSASIRVAILYHAGVEGDGAVGRDEERVDLDLGDCGVPRRDLREGNSRLRRRAHIARRPSPRAGEERRPAQREEHPLGFGDVERSETDRHVSEDLGV